MIFVNSFSKGNLIKIDRCPLRSPVVISTYMLNGSNPLCVLTQYISGTFTQATESSFWPEDHFTETFSLAIEI